MNTQYLPVRRKMLSAGASLAAASFFGVSNRVLASLSDIETLISEFTSGNELNNGTVTLTIPEVAENGFSVPMSVAVDSPMSAVDYVESVMVLAEENPNLKIATFHFSPASGQARVSTRMRLARTQDVLAIVRMSDGTFHQAVQHVKVTIGGCGV